MAADASSPKRLEISVGRIKRSTQLNAYSASFTLKHQNSNYTWHVRLEITPRTRVTHETGDNDNDKRQGTTREA